MQNTLKILLISLLSMSSVQSMDQIKAAAVGLTSCAATALSSGDVSTAVLSGLTDYTCANSAIIVDGAKDRINKFIKPFKMLRFADDKAFYANNLSRSASGRYQPSRLEYSASMANMMGYTCECDIANTEYFFVLKPRKLWLLFHHFAFQNNLDWVQDSEYKLLRNCILQLVQEGYFINAQDDKGCTALHWAVADGRSHELIDALLDYGADIALQDKYGNMPLHVACHNERESLVDLLLQRPLPIAAQNFKGHTVFHLIAIRSSIVQFGLPFYDDAYKLRKLIEYWKKNPVYNGEYQDIERVNHAGQRPIDLIPVNADGMAINPAQQQILDIFNEFNAGDVLLK